ncbi:sporulation membrane protein YtaF [Aquibacillus sp. 3ASR75-11]|uniref:Sporulation membrane protein YtaF n=1 Tax=Terrihalobacillus insolitus TaxID=2950438 RepID=A0A9X3WVA0_9BACI|nr:sporulation membrane protein YtaF [Terrihalobacillus insolitus]MDC3412613.1 sporulation membrane protein YtaF [Terrihalobacillus insolitus]MDC3423964.1 sporulation membrane protein YtaF [Terrihalobacillus insolitus]
MAEISTFILLAFAVSLDSFVVGFTYGLRQMYLPIRSIVIIATISSIVFFLSMFVGDFIASFLSPKVAEDIGGWVLILIGIWVIIQFFKTDNTQNDSDPILVNFEIKSLGIVIRILKKPMVADMDKSGAVTGVEAFLLGIALSMDSFGAGIGAALLGFVPLLGAVTIGITTALSLTIGLKSGKIFSYWDWLHRLTFIPGIILIAIGVLKMT